MCSSTDVLIFVVDFNDEVPTFDLPRYQVDINDSYSTGDVILQPVAIDRDSGRNAELIYFLEVGNLKMALTYRNNQDVLNQQFICVHIFPVCLLYTGTTG